MNLEKEENTTQFFKELENDSCDVELLYNLSLKGIYLYEPLFRYESIKYHEYVVDISLMNNQYFKIYNDKQYERLKKVYTNYEDICHLRLLLNRYIVNKFVNDSSAFNIFKNSDEYTNIQLYYLLKYRYISYKIFDFFKYDVLRYYLIIRLIFIERFYFKENINIMNINKYVSKDYLLPCIKGCFDRDIKALEFIISNINSNIKDNYCFEKFRIEPYYPLDLLSKYSSKISKPNILYFKHPDKDIETLFNSICGDKMLHSLYSTEFDINIQNLLSTYIENYNIPENLNNFNIINFEEYKTFINKIKEDNNNNSYVKYGELSFCNKDLLILILI